MRLGCRRLGAIVREVARRRLGDLERRCKTLLLAFVLPSVACFEYTAVPVTSPPAVGHRVRMELTPDGFARLTGALGSDVPRSGRGIEGDLVQASADQFLVAVRVFSAGAGEVNQLEQRVAVPVLDVVNLQVKTLDRQRTAYVAVGVGAAIVALVAHYVRGTFGGTTTGSGPSGPPE
jgi:hypothetical protein